MKIIERDLPAGLQQIAARGQRGRGRIQNLALITRICADFFGGFIGPKKSPYAAKASAISNTEKLAQQLEGQFADSRW